MLWTTVLVPALAFGETALDRAMTLAFTTCAPHATHRPPTLDARGLERLREGEVVQMLERGAGTDPTAAVGVVMAEASVSEAWLACQGPHAEPGENPEFLIESLPDHQAVWYGYVPLPWPLRDRQYIVKSRANVAMANATENRCWEHTWREYPEGLADVRPMVSEAPVEGITPEHLDRAVVTSWNRGSWLLAAVDDDHVLIMFQASLVVDGNIPDWIVPRITASKLDGMLKRVKGRAETWAALHYDRRHAPFLGGDGRVIPPLR